MTVQILKETPQHLVIHTEDGRVDTIINDSYTRLKYGDFEGERIHCKFEDGLEIAETFDDRIFNCSYRKDNDSPVETIQIRNEYSCRIADVVQEQSKLLYIELYKEVYFEKHKTELLNDLMINSYGGRVVARKDGSFVVDDVFMVNSHGHAHFISSRRSKNPQWNSLCIVVQGKLTPKRIDTKVGAIEFDPTLLTIMYKIDYLISPTVKYAFDKDNKIIKGSGLINNTFMSQLPEWLQKEIMINAGLNTRGRKK